MTRDSFRCVTWHTSEWVNLMSHISCHTCHTSEWVMFWNTRPGNQQIHTCIHINICLYIHENTFIRMVVQESGKGAIMGFALEICDSQMCRYIRIYIHVNTYVYIHECICIRRSTRKLPRRCSGFRCRNTRPPTRARLLLVNIRWHDSFRCVTWPV